MRIREGDKGDGAEGYLRRNRDFGGRLTVSS